MSSSAEYPLQPLTLIKAGAGAGKTFTIEKTLTKWIEDQQVRADHILAVTFTKAAANEMRSRIRVALLQKRLIEDARQLKKSTISTIHAFGLEILERFAYEEGLSPAPRQLTDQEQKLLIREALHQVQAIQPLMDNLEHYGYTGQFGGEEFLDSTEQLTKTILDVVGKLRSLGKDFDTSADEAGVMLRRAKDLVETSYGNVHPDGAALSESLWGAIEAVKAEYPEHDLLDEAWGSNGETRKMAKAIYTATRERLNSDWSLWTDLQPIETAPKIFPKKKPPHEHAHLAEAVWNAAEKLSVLPGPLRDALQHIQSLIDGALDALRIYQENKRNAGLVDYGDMVHLANNLLENPEWLDEIASEYDCLIIDEFQDTSPLQFALLRRFQQKGLPTFIVGDLKQSIMGFQGSDRRLFKTLMDESSENTGVVRELASNWRSTTALMGFINNVGSRLYGSEYQKLNPEAGYESDLPAVNVLHFNKADWLEKPANSPKYALTKEGNSALAHHLAQLLKSGQQVTDRHTKEKRAIRAGDIAILARKHGRLKKIAESLRKIGIEVQVKQPGFLDCDAVQWVLSALQALNNSRDDYAWLNLLTSPLVRGQSSEKLKALLKGYMAEGKFSDPLVQKLEPLRKTLRAQPIKVQLLTITEEAGLLETFKNESMGRQQRANIIKLIGLAEAFEQQQPETLTALGIVGKNAATFQVWLSQSKEAIDEQPGIDDQADDAIMLATWHASKGLEWPIVMVLDAENVDTTRYPNISMAYADGGIDTMLRESYLQILPPFHAKDTKEAMAKLLKQGEAETSKNLCYVALTRAREQIILPCWDGYKDGSMLSHIKPELDAQAGTDDTSAYAENAVVPGDADVDEQVRTATLSRTVLQVTHKPRADKINHTFSPSLEKELGDIEVPETETTTYSPPLNLNLHNAVPANELGVWVHRLYQVYLLQPELLDKALSMQPVCVTEDAQKREITAHLEGFKQHVNALMGSVRQWKCELQVTGLKPNGQVVSGEIDMLVEGEADWWLIDHKTDINAYATNHIDQLLTYRQMCGALKVGNLAINWARAGQLEALEQ